jgi:hypothetical protein
MSTSALCVEIVRQHLEALPLKDGVITAGAIGCCPLGIPNISDVDVLQAHA